MTRIDQMLRARLQSREHTSDWHPDANQLSAFAEHTLPRRERATLLDHIAQCTDCRSILAMSVDPSSQAAVTPARRHIPYWAWMGATAFVAASCAAVVWLIHPREPLTVAKLTPPELKVQPSREVGMAASSFTRNGDLVRKPVKKMAPMAEPAQPQFSAVAPVLAPSLQPPPQPPAAPLPQEQVIPGYRQNLLAAATARKGAVFPVRSDLSQDGSQAYPTPALWTIQAQQNIVERSRDNGKTWEPVSIAGQAFQAVAASGLHVWAGGSDGALFHSTDGGARWEPVAVSDGINKLTETIVSIDAPTPTQVRITTSSGKRWITSDAGRHWNTTPDH